MASSLWIRLPVAMALVLGHHKDSMTSYPWHISTTHVLDNGTHLLILSLSFKLVGLAAWHSLRVRDVNVILVIMGYFSGKGAWLALRSVSRIPTEQHITYFQLFLSTIDVSFTTFNLLPGMGFRITRHGKGGAESSPPCQLNSYEG